MEIKSLRSKLHQMVDKIDDPAALTLLMEDAAVYATTNQSAEDEFLTEEQWASIEEARKQIKAGDFKTYSQVKAHFEQWLTK